MMEERIWLLLELFISGQASANETGELVGLLHKHPDQLGHVEEFLAEFLDPNPQVTEAQKQALIRRARAAKKR
ncbi:hypothetical protein SAMN05216464_10848 [Mucilaginibacter pineti]|uniref:Uncharacterized protein n=1 Tax=Mucilaginibacter pineti TaxID=1391627 RepID=A0A1G7EJP1_9SPHI|nr:hypothetical protein [Mucilaginibacter pineti]SDE63626.1 hypothetical protein SAMN05216464_10848 [Mucilaginibacter pineti]